MKSNGVELATYGLLETSRTDLQQTRLKKELGVKPLGSGFGLGSGLAELGFKLGFGVFPSDLDLGTWDWCSRVYI